MTVKLSKWHKATEDVILTLKKSLIKSMWVYKIKFRLDGTKAHLIAKGYIQIAGIDLSCYFFTNSKNCDSKNFIFSCSTYWILEQLDVSNTILQGELEEEVCIQVPQLFSFKQGEHLVCRLNKSFDRLE